MPIVTVKVGGVSFYLSESLILGTPGTRLQSDLERIRNGKEYLGKNARIFESVVCWYHTRCLRVPNDVPLEWCVKEWDYWGIIRAHTYLLSDDVYEKLKGIADRIASDRNFPYGGTMSFPIIDSLCSNYVSYLKDGKIVFNDEPRFLLKKKHYATFILEKMYMKSYFEKMGIPVFISNDRVSKENACPFDEEVMDHTVLKMRKYSTLEVLIRCSDECKNILKLLLLLRGVVLEVIDITTVSPYEDIALYNPMFLLGSGQGFSQVFSQENRLSGYKFDSVDIGSLREQVCGLTFKLRKVRKTL